MPASSGLACLPAGDLPDASGQAAGQLTGGECTAAGLRQPDDLALPGNVSGATAACRPLQLQLGITNKGKYF